MKTSKTLTRLGRARGAFAGVTLLIGMVAFCTANATDITSITVSSPKVKVLEHGPGTSTAVEQVTVTAAVPYEPVTLTTNSGAALLKYGVEQAALRVCYAADPAAPADTQCIRNATHAAQPQVDAAIARAREAG